MATQEVAGAVMGDAVASEEADTAATIAAVWFGLSWGARVLYWRLAGLAENERGHAFASHVWLAKQLSWSVRTIERRLAELKAAAFVRVDGHLGIRRTYCLIDLELLSRPSKRRKRRRRLAGVEAVSDGCEPPQLAGALLTEFPESSEESVVRADPHEGSRLRVQNPDGPYGAENGKEETTRSTAAEIPAPRWSLLEALAAKERAARERAAARLDPSGALRGLASLWDTTLRATYPHAAVKVWSTIDLQRLDTLVVEYGVQTTIGLIRFSIKSWDRLRDEQGCWGRLAVAPVFARFYACRQEIAAVRDSVRPTSSTAERA